jgi:hypothetical protein
VDRRWLIGSGDPISNAPGRGKREYSLPRNKCALELFFEANQHHGLAISGHVGDFAINVGSDFAHLAEKVLVEVADFQYDPVLIAE